MKTRSASSARGKRAGKRVKPIPDSRIDFSEIPELSDEQLATLRRIDRLLKAPIKKNRLVFSKSLQQVRRRSAMLTGTEIVDAVPNDRRSAGW